MSTQGIGILQSANPTSIFGCMDNATCVATLAQVTGAFHMCYDSGGNSYDSPGGPASNYNPSATMDDGSCTYPTFFVAGCLLSTAFNYNPLATVDDNSCIWAGCTDATAYNYSASFWNDANAYSIPPQIFDDSSCITAVLGCTDSTMFNYNASANVDDGSCIAIVNGCTWSSASNFDPLANADQGDCTWYGCTNLLATNTTTFPAGASSYTSSNPLMYGIQDDGSCLGGGCMNSAATNYNATATFDDGSCVYCDWSASSANAYNGIPITTSVFDSVNSLSDSGQIAVMFNFYAPYGPYTYTLTDVNGVSTWTQYANQNIGGVNDPNSTLFVNLAPGDYVVTITGSGGGSVCNYNSGIITVGLGLLVVPGCTAATACNTTPGANSDDGTCEYVTCAGCIDNTANGDGSSSGFGANQTQTNTSTPCTINGTGITGPCTIACGDGNNNTSQGNYCCDYHVFGCDDPAMFNYYYAGTTVPANTTVINDGSCLAITYGCTAPSATNYDPLATTDDGSCIMPPVVNGCMDPTACNYDPAATTTLSVQSPCLYSLSNVTLGQTDGGPLGPAFYNVVGAHTFTAGMSSTSQTGRTSKKVRHMVVNDWPLSSVGQSDMGLSWQYNGPFLTSHFPPNRLKATIDRKVDPTNPNSAWYLNVEEKDFVNPQTMPFTMGLFTQLGVRDYVGTTWNFPYPWGSAQNDSNNYEFDVWYNNTTKHIYRLRLYQQHYMNPSNMGTTENFGNSNGVNTYPACGVSQVFEIQDLACSQSQFSQLGCTDQSACNYDMYATCDDGSCFYTTVQYWTPTPGGQSGCFECELVGNASCGTALPNCPQTYNYGSWDNDFYSATNSNGTPCIQNLSYDCGNIYMDESTCNTTGGAQATGGGGD